MTSYKNMAIELRKQGYSYSLIRQNVPVSLSTLSYWLRDVPYIPNEEVERRIKDAVKRVGLVRHQEKKAQISELRQQGIREIGQLTPRDLWMLGLGLYIGEGSKSIESVRIINSDPEVIKLTLRWFKESCNLKNNNIRLRIFLYPDIDEKEAIIYWHKITKVPKENFRKTIIDNRLNKKRKNSGKLPYGTLQVQIIANGDSAKGVTLFRKIDGWMRGVYNQI